MRIVIDATELGFSYGPMNGVARYIFHLIEGLARIDTANEYLVFFNTFRQRGLRRKMQEYLRLPANWTVAQASIPLALCELARLPVELQLGRFDVFHGTFDYLPPVGWGKRVVTVHDVRYLEEDLDRLFEEEETRLASAPPSVQKGVVARRRMSGWQRKTIAKTVNTANAIIAMSSFSARRIAEKLDVDPNCIHVVYSGVEQRFSPKDDRLIAETLRRHRLPSRYLLYVSRFDPLKNPLAAIRAFALIAHEYPDLHFVLCGPEDYYLPALKERTRREGCHDRVLFAGFMDDADLPYLYAGAELFVLPSFYEGFGLPLLEAFASGTPVVASSASSLSEVAGDAALLVDPHSTEAFRDAFRAILADRAVRDALRSKGRQRAAEFTWERCARNTLEIYDSLGATGREQ